MNAVRDLAEQLRLLKERTGRSYESLAGRTGYSRSTLHRYCSGAGVPADFDAVSRLARACGADRAELLELHRRWALASAAPRQAAIGAPVALAVHAPVEFIRLVGLVRPGRGRVLPPLLVGGLLMAVLVGALQAVRRRGAS